MTKLVLAKVRLYRRWICSPTIPTEDVATMRQRRYEKDIRGFPGVTEENKSQILEELSYYSVGELSTSTYEMLAPGLETISSVTARRRFANK
eukprot:3828442-Amphidinium_carterae.1